jgi:alcohol dehydrogenase (cytochrome c)
VTTQSLGYDRKSYTPLKQINTSTIRRLVPIWSTSLMNDMGELAAPTIYNGVMYVINGRWTFALDVETGQQIWRTPVEIQQRDGASAERRAAALLDPLSLASGYGHYRPSTHPDPDIDHVNAGDF